MRGQQPEVEVARNSRRGPAPACCQQRTHALVRPAVPCCTVDRPNNHRQNLTPYISLHKPPPVSQRSSKLVPSRSGGGQSAGSLCGSRRVQLQCPVLAEVLPAHWTTVQSTDLKWAVYKPTVGRIPEERNSHPGWRFGRDGAAPSKCVAYGGEWHVCAVGGDRCRRAH